MPRAPTWGYGRAAPADDADCGNSHGSAGTWGKSALVSLPEEILWILGPARGRIVFSQRHDKRTLSSLVVVVFDGLRSLIHVTRS